jgi:hypothetical protein
MLQIGLAHESSITVQYGTITLHRLHREITCQPPLTGGTPGDKTWQTSTPNYGPRPRSQGQNGVTSAKIATRKRTPAQHCFKALTLVGAATRSVLKNISRMPNNAQFKPD